MGYMIDGKIPPHSNTDFGDECPGTGQTPLSDSQWLALSKPLKKRRKK